MRPLPRIIPCLLIKENNLVKTINSLEINTGFRVGPISWDGRDDFMDNIGRGTYIYKLKIKDENGEFVEKLEKLVILK